MTKLSRRVFLGAAPAAAAEAAIKWDDTYNVIVIGAGLYKRARNPIGPRGGAYIKALLEVRHSYPLQHPRRRNHP